MRSTKSKGLADEKFGIWLRRESWRASKAGLLLFVIGLSLSQVLTALSPAFSSAWDRVNYQLSGVALAQHPLALARTFGTRLRESEYGWRLLAATAPFNVTAARQQLRKDYPEVASVQDGVPQVARAAKLRSANPSLYDQRLVRYLQRHDQIEAARFTRLYQRDDLFTPPNANVKLSIVITKVAGLPDAFFFTVGSLWSAGRASVLLFSTVLALAARALLKLLVWPALASALVWGAILFMAQAAAAFGSLTNNTSALTLFATIPFLYLLAQLPLQLGESLMLKGPPPPAKWDGVDRRQPRPPAPQPGETTPPVGGA